ncbi:MAG: hypothetical protein Q4E70_00225 [Candidatus Saccharibacteria bacterium]|nr:hypothetical protein [Candidatus Saccharibacteria bacterium]
MRRHGQNKNYFDTEKKLLSALARVLKEKRSFNIKTREVSREAKLAYSSFYIHHKSLSELVRVYEEAILSDVNLELKKALKTQNYSLEKSYQNILLALYRHRELLSVIINSRNIELPVKVIKTLKPLIVKDWRSYGRKTDEIIFYQLSAEIMTEIILWKTERFAVDEISKHAHRLAILTNNAPKQFAPLYYK